MIVQMVVGYKVLDNLAELHKMLVEMLAALLLAQRGLVALEELVHSPN